jgi:hypothetical protein
MGEGNKNTALVVLVIVLVAAVGLGIVCCGGVGVLWFMARRPVEAVAPPRPGDTREVQIMPTPAKEDAFTHTISVETEYYLGGPQQAQPPDGTFKAGTKVRLLEVAGSYCVVESEDGVRAWVAVDAVKLLGSNGAVD